MAARAFGCKGSAVAVRCLIVDDSPDFLLAARTLLEREGFAIVGTATTGDEARRLAEDLQPDVVLVDVRLGAENGIELSHGLPGVVILISTQRESEYSEAIDGSPAAGFIPKDELSAAAIQRLLTEREECKR
jgi:DNA-binding NarL/FixJ family response regulator